MKRFIFIATALVALASCSDSEFVGDQSPDVGQNEQGAIVFNSAANAITRAGELTGATAAAKLGGMFVVEGTKGSEQSDSPSKDVVFDNYLVGYTANTAATTESNTNNWEYVNLETTGITGHMTHETWTALHGTGTAQAQTIKYWDYSTQQYDFIAWSTGNCEAITGTAASGKVQVTRINNGSTLVSDGFTLTAASVNDLKECYFTDIITVPKERYGQPVTLTFKSMATKVRVALYETVPGYSVKDVKFYSNDTNPTAPTDLGTGSSADNAVLFTMGDDKLPKSGSVTVSYPHIGTTHRDASGGRTKDYNKASVSVAVGSTKESTQTFDALSKFVDKEHFEATGSYLGRDLTNATFAGSSADNYYTAVFPNSTGYPLTLRVDYTLVSTDGSGEEIHVYGAKAVVPSIYTEWQPNYAYTYIFKISDNSNGWTSKTNTDKQGLFPITFDAVVASVLDANSEQTTVTTVATPSITTYQQGHDHANKDEYSKSQKAGKDQTNVKDLYVQVMNNSVATPVLVSTLNASNSLLFAVSTTGAPISEATVMDALLNRTNNYDDISPVGRNGITLTKNDNISISSSGTFTEIVNGVDDNPITVTEGSAAKIAIGSLTASTTYAYVYVKTNPSSDEVVYNVASVSTNDEAKNYYEVNPTNLTVTSDATAQANKVYFVKNFKADGTTFDSYTFKKTKVGDSVTGLFEATIDITSASKASSYTEGNFYFDVYKQNKGEYAVKLIKVVE